MTKFISRSSYRRAPFFAAALSLLATLSVSTVGQAVPTSILLQPTGTQADVTWARIENDKFVIYYDSTQAALAQHALKAVERAYPDMSLLLGAKLKGQPPPPELDPKKVLNSGFTKIPVIISARSDGASFANLISQSLEIQSSETPPAALFQHELSHRIMYEHMDLNVGPAGRTFMLAMLPSWWTEGLPEYLTESLGRLETNGILRAMALNDTFLSWDRLHALYKASGDVSLRGYALSGRFFKYFLERSSAGDVRELHTKLTRRQLIPPFFTGAYFLIRKATGQWPGDLYETFKSDLKKQTIQDLEGMPRLQNIPNATRIFSSFGRYNFVNNQNTFVTPDFSTKDRKGGLEIYRFADKKFIQKEKDQLIPLSLQANDRLYIHPAEWTGGGFWTTSTVRAQNRTRGEIVSYYAFKGALDSLKDSSITERIDFPLGGDTNPPRVSRIVPTAPKNAAVLTTLNTESKLYMLNKELKQHTLLDQWRAPDTVSIVRPHLAHPESESALCAHVLVNSDEERTSIQRHCHGEPLKTIIPEGQLYIRDALMIAPDDFVLLTGWNDAQALVRWTSKGSELLVGLPDWVTSIEPDHQQDHILMRVYVGGQTELWRASLADLKRAHLRWSETLPATSQWKAAPKHVAYVPPFARYADEIRKKRGTFVLRSSANDLPTANTPTSQTTVSPAPYRYRHWMTYPNTLPPFLAGVWSFGFFSRPMVDEMERFYLQLFGTYYADPDISPTDRLALEANLVGNRVFDGWKANAFLRPRFNGSTKCKFGDNPQTYYCQLYLRESGMDMQLNRNLQSLDAQSEVHARLFSIAPSTRGYEFGAPYLGAQKALLGSAGGSLSFDLWNAVLFDKPLIQLSKRPIGLSGSLRLGLDTTHSIGAAKAGNGDVISPVSFQNYQLELTHSASYRSQALTLRNTYSSTGGGAPLNAKEYFRPFKTYIIGANDGLQDISLALAGNGLLNYNLTGRAQYRNSLSYTFPIVENLDTRFAIAYLEKIDGEVVLSRGGTAYNFALKNNDSISTLTGSMRLVIDIKGYQFNPAILYGHALDRPLWQLFTQIKFDQFW